jgi:histidinol-phosphate aminotransferase
MSVNRRRFLSGALVAGAASVAVPSWITARGHEAAAAGAALDATATALLHLDSNENPTGPCPAAVSAITGLVAEGARYPHKSHGALVAAIAKRHHTTADHVVVGCGSTEILVSATRAWTTRTAGLVAPVPTFESPLRVAAALGHPVREVPVDATMDIDLDALVAASDGAGLLFLCNPNNPTGRAHPLDAIAAAVKDVRRRSPGTVVLLDEAYVEYAEGAGMGSGDTLALSTPGIIVSRTLSKAYGLAGLRIGYAIGQPDTLRSLRAHSLPQGVNTMGIHAAVAALQDTAFEPRERARNAAVRTYLRERFEQSGYPVGDSHTNFLMVDVRRDCDAFRQACLQHRVAVGRRFTPLDTHVRISLGTMGEMQRAWSVFDGILKG